MKQHVELADRSPIFIVGRMRSGTTLLRQMLNAHPHIYLTFENDVFFYHWVYRKINDPFQWLEKYAKEVSFRLMEIDVDIIRDSLPPDLTMEQIQLVFSAIMREKAQLHGKIRYGDKTPNLGMNLSFIFKYFDDPRVIHIVRDPRSVVNSLERVPWGIGSRLCSTLYCSLEMRDLERFRPRILEVKMEELVANPRKTLEEVLAYVEEPWDDKVLQYQDFAPRDANHDWPGLSSATEKLNKKKGSGLSRDVLGPVWNRMIEKANKSNMSTYGYLPLNLEKEPRFVEFAVEVLKDIPWAMRYFYQIARLFYLIRYAEVPPQRKVDNVFDLNPRGWKYHPNREKPIVK